MKTKDLFKKLEGANYLATSTFALNRAVITCDYIDNETNIIYSITNEAYTGKTSIMFRAWDEFCDTIADGYSEDVQRAIAKTHLIYDPTRRVFYLKSEHFTLLFQVWNA